MALMGVGFGIGTGILVRHLTRMFSLKANFIYLSLLCAAMIFLLVAVKNLTLTWILIAPIAACIAVSYSSLLTLFPTRWMLKVKGGLWG